MGDLRTGFSDAFGREGAGDRPVVSVTIVLYNSEDHLRGCLDGIRADLQEGYAELIAVDNASPDDSARVVSREIPFATIIRSPVNRGFAAGCNLAWPRLRGRYWLLLNPDVLMAPGTVRALARWMDANPAVGAASPWLRDPATGDVRYPGQVFPSISRTVVELLRLHRLLPALVRGSFLQGAYVTGSQLAQGGPRPDWVPGAAMIVRREAVVSAGTLCDEFFLYGEDVEWCWRIRNHGWQIATCPDIFVTHYESASSRRTWRDDAVTPRIVAGFLASCQAMRGRRYARMFGLVTTLALAIESVHPRRSPELRRRYRSLRRVWWEALGDV